MNEDKDKKIYELAVLVKNEEDVSRALALAKQHNGEIVSEPRVKKIALAYKIEGETEAVFAYFNFQASGEDVKNLEQDLRSSRDIIRSLLVIAVPPSERRDNAMPAFPGKKRGRPSAMRPGADAGKPAAARLGPLSNEALEKKIEEILQ